MCFITEWDIIKRKKKKLPQFISKQRWVRKSFVVGFAGNLERGAPVRWISKFRIHQETARLSYMGVSQHGKQMRVNYTLKNLPLTTTKVFAELYSTNAFLNLLFIWSLLVHQSLVFFYYLLNYLIFRINFSC